MKFLSVALAVLASASIAGAQNKYLCPAGATNETITVKNKAKLQFLVAKKTAHNMSCEANYVMETCSRVKLACKFKLNGRGKACTGDQALVTANGKTTTLCKGKKGKYSANVNGDFSIKVVTDGSKPSKGGKCTIRCTKKANKPKPTTTTAAPTPPPTTGSGSTGGTGGSTGYTQAWLRGEGPGAHVHEGVQFADKSGWVGIGELLPEEGQTAQNFKVMIRAVDNNAATLWTTQLGDDHKQSSKSSYSVGYSVVEGGGSLYAGLGLWQKSSSQQAPAVISLNPGTGAVGWTTVLGQGQSGHGGVRSCIMDGQEEIVCVGYLAYAEPGFKFVADEGRPAVWRLDSSGALLTENILSVEGTGQLAKIRADPAGGFVACSTGWGVIGGQDVNVVAVVKLSTSLDIEWSQTYGLAGGNSQVFDMLVDNDGNYLLGGHTTVGDGVVNWDYLALKVNSQTKAEEWRRTYGQPRGFDARYIHDEMYGVALDNAGNYLLLGGSGDEYTYSASGSGQWAGWASDTWGSYLVVVSPSGDKLYENFYGKKGGNNAGEWLTYDQDTGNIMVYTDSDTAGGFGFLKLKPT